MANSKIREAIRKAYVSKANRNGPADLVRADQEAGPRIHRDENTWTVATPEEFRAGMSETAKRGSGKKKRNDDEELKQELAYLLGGRRKKYIMDKYDGSDPESEKQGNELRRRMGINERAGRDPSGAYNLRSAGHGARTYSEQFTEPEDESKATNAEERALLRERDRLDPYGKPTRKMRVQDKAREAIAEEFRRRRGT